MKINSFLFQKFIKHVLFFEGGLANDPRDTAVQYAPFPGAYHTNKGVTYGTFTALAKKLGIIPVDYKKFISLTDEEIGKFIYDFYLTVNGNLLPDSVGLSLTEVAWGSGPRRAIINLQDALINLGKLAPGNATGTFGPLTKKAIQGINEQSLFTEFWKLRQIFIDNLTASPKYAIFSRGWNRRIQSFLKNIKPSKFVLPGILIAGVVIYILNKQYKFI
jgi:lysozyme family protein